MYMDRTYVPQNEKMPVHELGLHLWKECVVRAPRIKERLLQTLLEMIYKERTGEDVKRDLLKSVTQMLTDLGRAIPPPSPPGPSSPVPGLPSVLQPGPLPPLCL